MLDQMLGAWGGETVIIRSDTTTGTWMVVALHSSRLGPPTGGTRMKPYPDLESALQDALRLSRGMTYKFATPGLPSGGAKAVLMVPEDLDPDARSGLLRRYGEFVAELDGRFRTGPDLGTTSEDMDVIAEHGAPYVFSRTIGAGGAGDPGPFTAVGVFTAIQVAAEHGMGSSTLAGVRVLVQGAGGVGAPLIDRLRRSGADVSFSDIDETRVRHMRDDIGLAFVSPDDALTAECDVLAPCALGGILNAATIARLRCRVVAGSANNQLETRGDAARLRSRGILYAPDYVANVGGAMAVPGIELTGWTRPRAEKEVVDFVSDTLLRIFSMAGRESLTTDEAAQRIAEQHLSNADG